jgi:hypothetical protein
LKRDQWGFLPGPGAGIARVTSVRATVFLIISAGGCAWRAALDIDSDQVRGRREGAEGPPPRKAVPWKPSLLWPEIATACL